MASICNVTVRPQLALSTSAARLSSKPVSGLRASALPKRTLRVTASQAGATEITPKQKAESMGFDTSEGFFGFTPFSELWVGRLAMAGFFTGVAEELVTGQSILQQIGVADGSGLPSPAIFYAILALALVPTGAATVNTLRKVASGDMTVKQFKGYARFFGLDTEEDAKVVSTMRKLAMMDDLKGLSAKDTSLTVEDAAACEWPNPGSAPSSKWPRPSAAAREAMAEFDYAKGVEMDNGRWAMIGFLLAILVEAGTGMGVVEQIMFYIQTSGFLYIN